MKVASHALGCKVNQYESEAIAELFQEKGYEIVGIEDTADIYVINTCTVTNFGDKKSRQLIRRVKRQNPNAIVVVAGCYAQTQAEEVSAIAGVNLVVGTKGRQNILALTEKYLAEKQEKPYCLIEEIKNEREFEPLSVKRLSGHTRAYIKIQDGCSQFCSYCIIPYARGPIRSRPPEEVMQEVRTLADNGFQEVVLTGIHVASYGRDGRSSSLLELLRQVQEVPGIRRIRLSSLEPGIITEDFAREAAGLSKLCPHFHLSLQSGCDRTLSAMNRKYTTKQYHEAAERLRRCFKDVALTTDIIVGFPGETEEDFRTSYRFAEEIEFSKIHVFPYSAKRGTPAAKMPEQILNEDKAERARVLGQLSRKMGRAFLEKHKGSHMEVLFERETEAGIYEGLTGNYIRVLVSSDLPVVNSIKMVKIEEIQQDLAVGRLL